MKSLGWDHFLDYPYFVPSSQRNATSGWKGKGSLSPGLSPIPSSYMDRLQAAKGSLWEMGTCLGICRAIMVLGDNGIAYPHVVQSHVQPQLGLCHWDARDRHQLSQCPSDISLDVLHPKLQRGQMSFKLKCYKNKRTRIG